MAAVDAELGLVQWVARVPSASNVADGPFRLDFADVGALPGARLSEVARCARVGTWADLATRLEY